MASTEPINNKPSKTAVPLESATPKPEQVDSDTQNQASNLEKDGVVSKEEQSQPALEEQNKTENQPDTTSSSDALFQAIGIITGKVNFILEGDKERSTITIGNKEYPLFYASRKQRAFEALKKEIEATGESTQRLVVYPKFTHFPGRDQPPNVGFQVVGFDKGRQSEVISEQLQDMEFKLCGLWQFIPVCRTPCISVFKNFSKERLDYIKQSEPAKKVKYMKASHLPLFWRDALVPPFRFNPKAPKEEQGRPVFVQIKAKFVPHRDAFEFDSLLELPRELPPRFLKASKDDKATAMAQKKAALKAAGKEFGPPRGKPTPSGGSAERTFKGKPKGDFKGKPKEMPKPKPKTQQ
jgi:hypothetical protein